MRMRHLALASVYLINAVSAAADQQSCVPDTKPGVQQIAFDAATGTVDTGKSLKMKDEIQIVITNLNPFRYEYEFQINEEEIISDAVNDFLKLLALPGFGPPETPTTPPAGGSSAPTGGAPAGGNAPADPCAAITDATNIARAATQLLKPATKALETTRKKLKETVDGALRRLQTDNATCHDLQDMVDKIKVELDTQSVTVAKDGKTVHALLGRAEEALQALDTALAPTACTGAPVETAKTAKNEITDAIAAAKTQLEEARELDGDVEERQAGNASVAGNRAAFTRVIHLGPYEVPTKVTVTVKRRDLKPTPPGKMEDWKTFVVNFTETPRFSLAGGLAFASTDSAEFDRVQGIPLDISGAPTSTTFEKIIGKKADSSGQILPMVVLHARVYEFRRDAAPVTHGPSNSAFPQPSKRGGPSRFSLHLSLGLTKELDEGGSGVGYITGLSFGFARDRFFATLGVVSAERKVLAGDLYEGQAWPDASGDIQTKTERTWSPAVAVTYKFK